MTSALTLWLVLAPDLHTHPSLLCLPVPSGVPELSWPGDTMSPASLQILPLLLCSHTCSQPIKVTSAAPPRSQYTVMAETSGHHMGIPHLQEVGRRMRGTVNKESTSLWSTLRSSQPACGA